MGHQPLTAGVVQQGGRASQGRGASVPWIKKEAAVHPIQSCEVGAERTLLGIRRWADFVVTNEQGHPVRSGERRHAVVSRRHEQSVGHVFPRSGEDPVAETARQGDDSIRVVEQGSKAEIRVHISCVRIGAGTSETREAE